MKLWLRHILTIAFGLLVYSILIAINDVYSPDWNRWERGWLINAVEITMSLSMAYGCRFIAEKWEKWRRNRPVEISLKGLLKELLLVYLSVFLFINAFGGPIMEVTDNYDLHDMVVINVIPGLFTLVYYFILRSNFYLKQYIQNSVKLEKLESDKIREELKYLKNQIHPHFLFNALNTIYFQMDESVEQAKRSVEMFSELLRYRLYDDQGEKTSLQKELDFVQNYIAFERLRHPDRLNIDLSLPQIDPDVEIYPFLINPGIENAFKYVGGEMCIKISISLEGRVLKVKVENSKRTDLGRQGDAKGIGLSNLRRRLELLYPGRFELMTNDFKDSYQSELKIDLDAST